MNHPLHNLDCFLQAISFVCANPTSCLLIEAGHKQTAKSQNKQPSKKTKTISDFFAIPESMSRYRRSTSQYRRSTSQHGRSTSCPRVVLGSLCFQHAIFFLAEILCSSEPPYVRAFPVCSRLYQIWSRKHRVYIYIYVYTHTHFAYLPHVE